MTTEQEGGRIPAPLSGQSQAVALANLEQRAIALIGLDAVRLLAGSLGTERSAEDIIRSFQADAAGTIRQVIREAFAIAEAPYKRDADRKREAKDAAIARRRRS